MNKKFKIAFCGRSGSGKDTAAEYLSRHFVLRRFALADPVKAAVAAAFPHFNFARYGKNEPIPALGGKSKRQLWQTLGTEWGRNMVFQDIWVDGLLRRIRHVEAMNPNYRPSIVVTDVRFNTEAFALKMAGFHIVKIVRPGTYLHADLDAHESESGVDFVTFDELVTNDGTIEGFQQKIMDVVVRLQGE